MQASLALPGGRFLLLDGRALVMGNLEAALPVLTRFGFSATVYVVSGSIGRFNSWDAERLGIRKRLMSAEELRRWQAAGMEVGAHTQTHPRLTQCNEHQLRTEIHGSKADLEDRIGAPVTQFCYPYGDVDQRVADVTREAGYAAATAPPCQKCLHLR
jgi:peptidoglycan/xylan/chitin deacetylase (PgdA/CDA1 family)